MSNRLIDAIEAGLDFSKRGLVADGAMGTMLSRMGLPTGTAPEYWNITNPDAVSSVHQAYVDAGADVVGTNTFGGSPIKLNAYDLGSKAYEINMAAAKLAASTGAIIGGCVGPTGKLLDPYGDMTQGEAIDSFRVQTQALAEGGVDFLLLETFSDLGELQCAISASLETGLPVVACMSFDTGGRTMMGVSPKDLVDVALATGCFGVGTNCGGGAEQLSPVVEELLRYSNLPVIAQPNAGLPELIDGKAVFSGTPQSLAEFAVRFKCRLAITGACCGSSPEHIKAIAQVIKSNL